MHINEANLANLTGLWKKYGSSPSSSLPLVYSNLRWPYRAWVEWSGEKLTTGMYNPAHDLACLVDLPDTAILPVWRISNDSELGATTFLDPQDIEKQLLKNNWRCSFKQLAMYLELQTTVSYLPLPRQGFVMTRLSSLHDVKTWVDIGSDAFNYTIDRAVIDVLLGDDDIQLLLGWQDELPVCCALLFKTGEFIGIHQVGVKRGFQGQGIARYLMLYLLDKCIQWQGKYAVLQASHQGQSLYESLGFKAQFHIKNYQKA